MKKKIFFIFLILIFVFLIFFLFFISLFFQLLKPIDPNNDQIKSFLIEKGEGIVSISENLKKENLIKSKYSFIFYNILKGRKNFIKAGNYVVSSSMSAIEISDKFFLGEVEKKIITIIEGWKIEDIKDYLEKEKICLSEEFLEIIEEDFSEDFDFLIDKPKTLNIEGYLFPDTYEIDFNNSCREVILKMLNNFSKKLTEEMKRDIFKKEKTIFEIINVASLIEKEVKIVEDKKIVSGIIWRRLSIGMPLQIDATIIYLTNKRTTRISLEELKIDSLYNTYLYRGLPIGPISNPGIDSILSSIYPKETEFLFYLSTPEGETIFSKNLMEHNIAKAKYLK